MTPTIPAQQKVTELPVTTLKRYHKQLYLKIRSCTRVSRKEGKKGR
mgnify:FL=1